MISNDEKSHLTKLIISSNEENHLAIYEKPTANILSTVHDWKLFL